LTRTNLRLPRIGPGGKERGWGGEGKKGTDGPLCSSIFSRKPSRTKRESGGKKRKKRGGERGKSSGLAVFLPPFSAHEKEKRGKEKKRKRNR